MKHDLEALLTLDDAAICQIAFLSDPLHGRLTTGDKWSLYSQAADEGVTLAKSLPTDVRELPIPQLVAHHGGQIQFVSQQPDPSYALFAYYEKPANIVINELATAKAEQFIAEQGLAVLPVGVSVNYILLCHELYHLITEGNRTLFSQQRQLPLFTFGRFKLKRTAPCLEEIAAMAFTKELLTLPCSPYAFNVFMLFPFFPQQAQSLLHRYLASAEVV